MKKIHHPLLIITALLFYFSSYSQTTAEIDTSTQIVLKDAFIINGKVNTKIKKGSIIIKNDKIAAVVYDNDFTLPENSKVINLEGKYVVPGLIDAHVHLATVPKMNLHLNQKETESVLKKMLFAGITTVRDMAGNGAILGYYKRASKLNLIPAPEIYFAAQFAGPTYFNQINSYKEASTEGSKPWSRTITDSTNMKLAVAEAKGVGVTGIKIYSDLSAELVEKITTEAHRQGLKAWAHAAVFPALPSEVINAKVNTISHAYDMAHEINHDIMAKSKPINPKQLDELFEKMIQYNIILDPTNYLAQNNGLKNGVKITKRAHKKGVKIVAGTDWPYNYDKGIPLIKELQILVSACGFTPLEAINSATQIGAESIGLKDRGVIAINKRADILVFTKNPMNDIQNLLNPIMIIKGGIIIKSGK